MPASKPGWRTCRSPAARRQAVTALLTDARGELSLDEFQEVAHAHSRFLNAAAVDFWLGSLEALPGNETDSLFGNVASALGRMPQEAKVRFVLDVERQFPSNASTDDPVRELRRWSPPQYAKVVIPRLRQLEKREPERKVVP